MNLVTGATGIIGSQVVLQLLQQGKPVIAAKQKNSSILKTKKLFAYYGEEAATLFDKIKWVDLDICDMYSIEEALKNVTNVYHCAGAVSFLEKDIEKLRQVNEIGTANMVNVCLDHNIQTFCHVSSIAAINNNDYLGKLSEGVFWKTSGQESYYAISKYNAEREVWRGIEEGLNAVIVNPGVVLSPGFWDQSSGKLFKFAHKGNRFYTEGKTGYVMVEDVAKIMIRLVESTIRSERFIVVENNYTNKEILTLIQKGFDQNAPGIKLGSFILNNAAFLDGLISKISGKARQLSRESVRSTLGSKEFSNEKIKKILGFEFAPISQGIPVICKAFSVEE